MTFPLDKSQYKIISQIGKGATASVYVAECIPNGKIVALKTIDLESCPIEIEHLRHEVVFWSTSQSPNIVEYYGSFVDGPILYIIMEYMSAGSCYEIMRYAYKRGIQDECIIAAIIHEVLNALVYFHENRQIHRDIKAGNILINENGDIKIGDFGIAANLLENGQRKRARFTVIGTPCYMAPEVLKEEEGYTEKADVWSLGITAIELALGAAPYSNLYPLEVIVKIVNSPPPQLPDESRFSAAFKDFVKQCLVHSPAKRPSSKQLLEHKFFKQVKDVRVHSKKLIAGLPPLESRFQQVHSAQTEQGPKKERTTPIVWDFSLDDVKTETAKQAPEQDLIVTPAAQVTEPQAEKPSEKPTIKTSITVTPIEQQSQQQPQQGEAVKKFGKFTITKSSEKKPADEPVVSATPAEPTDKEVIVAMQGEIKELNSRVDVLREQNIALKSQLDNLTELVKKLLKNDQ
jgi:serine/threonine-protein kinase OSR1/STK39